MEQEREGRASHYQHVESDMLVQLLVQRKLVQLLVQRKGEHSLQCCCSAEGVFVPPMLIYPRIRVKPEFLYRAPTGAIAGGSKNGWITRELFEKWFDHFLKAVHPEAHSQKVLLILDGHSSHTRNINVINKAHLSNVVLLSLPSHCTHKLQPLDLAFFKSANTFYDQSASSWLRLHPGQVITEKEIVELFDEAYGKAATVKNATSGFQKSGIWPFNEHIFMEEHLLVAAVTERPHPNISDTASSTHVAECADTCNNVPEGSVQNDNAISVLLTSETNDQEVVSSDV